jgi:hypothetical protein
MKLLLLAPLLLLTACSIVPVKREFPKLPPSLEHPCVALEEVPSNTKKLSEVLITVTNNYTLYHECQLKVDAWMDWYKKQQEIFNKVK